MRHVVGLKAFFGYDEVWRDYCIPNRQQGVEDAATWVEQHGLFNAVTLIVR